MAKSNRKIGDEAETLACAYLEKKGWQILQRNYFFDHAEIDIIARDGQATIVFVEVKMRTNTRFGHPQEFVTEAKARHVFNAAEAWIYAHKMNEQPVRFDIIAILQASGNSPQITHITDAYR